MPSLSQNEIIKMYELLVLSRTFDHRALDLQREEDRVLRTNTGTGSGAGGQCLCHREI